jgi:cellulose synthase/poly-beta-1,6-N-acetylglucosamine synthase-like glycosyltransferase
MMAVMEWLTVTWTTVGTLAAILSLPGTVELTVLTLGAALPKRRSRADGLKNHWRLAVIVPAHNEETNIRDCVQSIALAKRSDCEVEIVVVADNCDDRTAEVAESAGARVLARRHATVRGKGYALDFAFNTLLPEGFNGFLIVDADSAVESNFLIEMGQLLREGADAVQCRYLVKNSASSIRTRLMGIALRAFNVLRPRGRDHLGLSCGIYGNGFGLRRETLQEVPYLASSVVEDLEYHLALVRSGKSVRFVNVTAVFGEMPTGGKGVATQRARWEGGRFRMLREKAPKLFRDVLSGRIRAIEPLLDLLLLPLAFHVSLLIVAASTPWMPARTVGLGGLFIVLVHLTMAIVLTGGGWRDAVALLAAPFYILWKLFLIPLLIRNSRANAIWVRTARGKPQ